MAAQKIKVYTGSSVGIDYFNFLNKTIERAGFDVTPLFLISESEYRKLSKKSGFLKVWLRIKMYIIYPLYLIYKGLTSKRNSIFVISSNTFFAPLLMQWIVNLKKGKVIHMLYDLYPDALEVTSLLERNSIQSKLVGNITRLGQKYCRGTVYLGQFLKEHAEKRWGNAHESEVIDISTDTSLYEPAPITQQTDEKLIIHYGGQMGHLHDANSIINSVKYVCNSDLNDKVEFNFYVSGAQASYLGTSLSGYPVKIISAVSSHQWRNDISNFHIGLVSLSPGGATVCLPSKCYSMMAGGLAILAICPEWSDLAALVKDNNCGWVINNAFYNNKEELQNAEYLDKVNMLRAGEKICKEFYDLIRSILNDKAQLALKRENSYYSVRSNYGIDELSVKWSKLINKVNI